MPAIIKARERPATPSPTDSTATGLTGGERDKMSFQLRQFQNVTNREHTVITTGGGEQNCRIHRVFFIDQAVRGQMNNIVILGEIIQSGFGSFSACFYQRLIRAK